MTLYTKPSLILGKLHLACRVIRLDDKKRTLGNQNLLKNLDIKSWLVYLSFVNFHLLNCSITRASSKCDMSIIDINGDGHLGFIITGGIENNLKYKP